ncbi:hypothetical protein ASG35_11670 [Burkholderia sp. Leaf177]|uniref:hypothetical protein n=1 Tax=Burkholderia sp. Leaf177 TaxID=1736287 RepID=UPI0006FE9FEF|nr:hypothetical protein [Burkholderia sp. Leaf177]KQR76937.1 hypothetical protein ASG35_11670 [Burkholderia sp. Leaf177]
MNKAEAKGWLRSRYGSTELYAQTSATTIPTSELLDVLSHIPSIVCGSEADKQARQAFLFDFCARQDRWRIPTPFTVKLEHQASFRRCVSMFSGYESKSPMNSPVFVLHALRDELYEKFAGVPLPMTSERLALLDELSLRIGAIVRPHTSIKAAEFDSEIAVVTSILDGLRDGTLRTIFRTSLPYAMSAQTIELRTIHRGIQLTGSLIPKISQPSSVFNSGGTETVAAEMNTSRWPSGATSVDLHFAALVDPSVEAPALRIPSAGSILGESWPNGFNVVFDVIYEVCWHVRYQQGEAFGWIPSPSDIGQLESRMSCGSTKDFGLIWRNNPASLMKAFVPPSEPLVVEGEMRAMPWHRKCRELAQQHARVGDTREALFWLNVGTESLINDRMRTEVAKYGSPIGLDSLDSSDAYWDDARQLVETINKAVADQIDWPTDTRKPSRFKQLKYVCRKIKGAPSLSSVQSSYSKVSKDRNALFHGENESPVSVEAFREATAGYDWLDQHFFPDAERH